MEHVGYSLVDSNGNEVKLWGNSLGQRMRLPNTLILPSGDISVSAPKVGDTYHGYTLLERYIDPTLPASTVKTGETKKIVDNKMVISFTHRPLNHEELKEYAAQKRRELTNGSHTVTISEEKSFPVWVDTESRGSLTGLMVATSIIPDLVVKWKGADSNFYELNAAEIPIVSTSVMNFIQTCFEVEGAAYENIHLDNITTKEAIDQLPWPV